MFKNGYAIFEGDKFIAERFTFEEAVRTRNEFEKWDRLDGRSTVRYTIRCVRIYVGAFDGI